MTVSTGTEEYLTFSHGDVYRKSALAVGNDTDKVKTIVFIPGNPGLIDFYTVYLGLVQNSFPEYNIVCIGHDGYAKMEKEFLYFNLEHQISQKHRYIREYVLKENMGKKVELSFLCHSMGAWMMQRLVKLLLEDEQLAGKMEIKFVGLICPTIVDIWKSSKGRKFTHMFAYLPVVWLFLMFSRLLTLLFSESSLKWIIRKVGLPKPVLKLQDALDSWDNSVEGAYLLITNHQILEQTLLMAEEELQQIRRHDEINDWFFELLPKENGINIWCFFAGDDYWVHDSTRDYILKRYHDMHSKKVRFEVRHGIDHSFCVHQSVEFAAITVEMLEVFGF